MSTSRTARRGDHERDGPEEQGEHGPVHQALDDGDPERNRESWMEVEQTVEMHAGHRGYDAGRDDDGQAESQTPGPPRGGRTD